MNKRIYTLSLGLLMLAGVVVLLAGSLAWGGLHGALDNNVSLAQVAQEQPRQNNAVQLSGPYAGAVKLNVVVGGVFSDTLVVPTTPLSGTEDLGSIDLSLQLTQTGNLLNGYVSLDKTLVFSAEHTLGSGAAAIKIGPLLAGSFDGTTFTVQSERVTMVASGRTVQRQFRLIGTSSASDGSEVKGEYRETLWGYMSVPVTVIGNFTLLRPVFDVTVPTATNNAPLALSDSTTTPAGVAVTINVLANDIDPDNDPLTISSVSNARFGTTARSGPNITYTPNAGFVGSDSFTYVVTDGKGGEAIGSVSVTVGGGGQPGANPLYLPLVYR
ncbi:MAG: hypothetical protein DYG89_43500 [Caldilinea sp. CFX5]|nr:hypothetical protein [Caldilinea sp. CFX5]